jgi:hypothetical protein
VRPLFPGLLCRVKELSDQLEAGHRVKVHEESAQPVLQSAILETISRAWEYESADQRTTKS